MIDAATVLRSDFPESFRPVVDLIGIENAVRLVNDRGGMPIFVPCSRNRANAAGWLTDLIGEEAFDKMADEFLGSRVHIPSEKRVRAPGFKREVEAALAAGERVEALARRLHVSTGLIYKLCPRRAA